MTARVLFRLPALLAAGLLAACSGRVAGGGDASETGNALAGTLLLEGGSAARGARVTLVPADWQPVRDGAPAESLATVSDAEGRYRFKRVSPGRYNLAVHHPLTGGRAFIQDVRVASDEVVLPGEEVRPPGALSLAVPDWVPAEGGHLYVPGSLYRVAVEQARLGGGRVLFDSLPACALPEVRYVLDADDDHPVLVGEDLQVSRGAVGTVHPYAAWSGRARVVLNTAASGILVERDLHDFPLLVRLRAPLFDRARARGDLADLRFAKADGTPLPYALAASWPDGVDAWVRLDTVRAQDTGQALTVHWGKADAAAPLGPPAVFDTAAGFAGAWHLEESAADTAAAGLYRDATQAGNHADDRVLSAGKPGVVGAGQAFARGDYIQDPQADAALRLAGAFTITAWFRTGARPDAIGGEMVSVGDNFALRLQGDGRLQLFFWPVSAPATQPPWYSVISQGADFLDGEWHLAQGSFDGSTLRLYLDGRETASSAAPGPVDFRFPVNLTLGRHGTGKAGFDYQGDLDEVQIHSRARGADWHRLSHGNQKPGSGFPAVVGP